MNFTGTKVKDLTFYCHETLDLAIYHLYSMYGQRQNHTSVHHIVTENVKIVYKGLGYYPTSPWSHF